MIYLAKIVPEKQLVYDFDELDTCCSAARVVSTAESTAMPWSTTGHQECADWETLLLLQKRREEEECCQLLPRQDTPTSTLEKVGGEISSDKLMSCCLIRRL